MGATSGTGTTYTSGAPSCFNEVSVIWSLALCVCFVDRCLSFCHFSFGHCVFCSTSIYEFLLPIGIFKLFLHARRIGMSTWSYGSWMYNYLYNQCISSLKLWSSFNLAHGQVYNNNVIKFVSNLQQDGGCLRVLRFHPPIKPTFTI
jgi:hypothetical protein